jgi:subtilase family serine protease
MKHPHGILLAGLSLLALSLAPCLHADADDRFSDDNGTVTPPLHWKYGWKDGRRANTIGNFKASSPLPAPTVTLPSGYSPAQISAAYGFNLISTNGNGAGQTIAVVVAFGSPTIQSDLDTFCATYGIPSTTVSVYYPQGKPPANSGWAAETMLDVEWAHAMAPGATIAVIVAKDSAVNNLLTAVNYAYTTVNASIVTMSWGVKDFSGSSKYDTYFNHPGMSFVAASGDIGAQADWPACSANVLGVGGTSLIVDSNNQITSETAWSGSGGGVSSYVTLPSYQVGFNNNSGRGIPDVSYVADPYTGVAVYGTDPVSKVAGWNVYGGTSAGAPQWAALLARRNSLGNRSTTTAINPILYGAAKTNYSSLFGDITAGSNGFLSVTGYDLATGLGSPKAQNVAALPSPSASVSPTPTPTPTPTPSPTATPRPRRG